MLKPNSFLSDLIPVSNIGVVYKTTQHYTVDWSGSHLIFLKDNHVLHSDCSSICRVQTLSLNLIIYKCATFSKDPADDIQIVLKIACLG